MTAGTPSSSPALRGRPARRGSRRAARCARAPGLVTIASPREALAVNAAANLAVMVRPVDGADELTQFLADRRLNAFAIGPGVGVGEATCALVLAALAGERAVVLDADAMTSFADEPAAARRGAAGGAARADDPDAARGRIFSVISERLDEQTKVGSKLERARLRGAAHRRGRAPQRRRYRGRRAGRPGGDRGERAGLSGDRGRRRRADRNCGGAAGARHAGLRSGRARRSGCMARRRVRFGPGLISEDLPEALPARLSARCWRDRDVRRRDRLPSFASSAYFSSVRRTSHDISRAAGPPSCRGRGGIGRRAGFRFP